MLTEGEESEKSQFTGKQQPDGAEVGVKAMDRGLDLYKIKGGEPALGGVVLRPESETGGVR